MSADSTFLHVPQRGDVHWVDPNPVARREMRDRHRFVVVMPREINRLGVSTTVPVASGGPFARLKGLTVSLFGNDTAGVAVCSQARSFDIQTRALADSARYWVFRATVTSHSGGS